MEITPLGDAALTIRCFRGETIQPEELETVQELADRLRRAELAGVQDVAAAYGTIAVFYDPTAVSRPVGAGVFSALVRQIFPLFRPRHRPGTPRRAVRRLVLPVCYEEEFAPDLAVVAERAGLTPREVMLAHAGATYRVACIGFAPGFPYLVGLPCILATPRRETPRTQVAAGAVGIGGRQTGIYPHASPGGWNLIGRTPLRLFHARRTPPARLAVGDEVRFAPITRREFDLLAATEKKELAPP